MPRTQGNKCFEKALNIRQKRINIFSALFYGIVFCVLCNCVVNKKNLVVNTGTYQGPPFQLEPTNLDGLRRRRQRRAVDILAFIDLSRSNNNTPLPQCSRNLALNANNNNQEAVEVLPETWLPPFFGRTQKTILMNKLTSRN